jgi:hypothetical protein
MNKREDLKQTLIDQPTLLSFESQRDYRRLEDAIRNHIRPRNILDEMWTSEIIAANRKERGWIATRGRLSAWLS